MLNIPHYETYEKISDTKCLTILAPYNHTHIINSTTPKMRWNQETVPIFLFEHHNNNQTGNLGNEQRGPIVGRCWDQCSRGPLWCPSESPIWMTRAPCHF